MEGEKRFKTHNKSFIAARACLVYISLLRTWVDVDVKAPLRSNSGFHEAEGQADGP